MDAPPPPRNERAPAIVAAGILTALALFGSATTTGAARGVSIVALVFGFLLLASLAVKGDG